MLAALLGALSLFVAAPTQAQTTVWSATLTVGDLGANGKGCVELDASSKCSSAFTDNNFDHNDVSYDITELRVLSDGRLVLTLSSSFPDSLLAATLRVDSTDFASSSASVTGSQVVWSSSGLNWSAGDTVSLSLVLPATPAVPPPFEFNLSASPDPVPWDGTGAITITAEVPQDVSMEIVNRGLCVWDNNRFDNIVTVNVPDGSSEKKVGFSVARNEGYYNGGEDCHEENKEDCKKCFFIWSASWTTDGEEMSVRNIIVLPILPPSGTSAPTRTSTNQPPSGPSTGGGPPTGGGPSSGGGSPPGETPDPTPDSPRCGESDREYLESFYVATGGEDWYDSKYWNSEEPLDEWFGVKAVETDGNEEVVSLRLANNNLSGDIPEELLSCLSELKELALWGNEDLSGEVPEELLLAVERAALREIAEMLNLNPEWFEDYEDPFNFEDWHEGVTTDDEGRVTELDLTGEGVIGEIPEILSEQLQKLRGIMITTSDGGCALGASSERMGASALLVAIFMLLAVSRGLKARSH